MKRILTAILLAAMLLSLFSMAAFADDPPTEGGIYSIALAGDYDAVVSVMDADGGTVRAETAEIDGDTVDFYANGVKLQIQLNGLTDGDYFLLIAQTDEELPDKDNIVFIDQLTVSGGSVTFTVYPRSLDAGEYFVYFASNKSAREELLRFKYYVSYKLGDVNEDTKVDSLDALMALQSYAGILELTANQKLAGDVDKSGKIDAIDALTILQAYAGILTLG